jgi:hypothetical protein
LKDNLKKVVVCSMNSDLERMKTFEENGCSLPKAEVAII